MSFTLAMYYKPAYQKRYGLCKHCNQGIVAGSPILIGTGYWNGQIIKQRYHRECFYVALEIYLKAWYFKNEYKPIAMAPEVKAELNRLRAKRYYLKQKGGEPYETVEKLEEVERQIALVKAGSKL